MCVYMSGFRFCKCVTMRSGYGVENWIGLGDNLVISG
jgi:hypothetical protein